MPILDRLENIFARFAVPGLIRYVVALNALVFILLKLNPDYMQLLVLDRTALMRGEVWRLISWIFLPTTTNWLWILCFLSFTWWIGDLLEASWGTFRLNAFYILGVIFSIVSALVFDASGGNGFLTMSLLFAAATLAPNLEILFLYILPLKLKWVAFISLFFTGLAFMFGSLATQGAIIMCLGNYLVFFGPSIVQAIVANKKTQERRSRFEASKMPDDENIHQCDVCGITERTNPEVEFRVSADGREYCKAHLPNHSSSN